MKKILVVFLALAITIAPVMAEARAGSSFGGSHSSSSFSSSRSSSSYSAPSRPSYSYSNSSVGSKGSQTYAPSPTYKPITKSVTPPAPAPVASTYSAPRPAYVAPAPTPTYVAPSPVYHSGGGFFSSMAGGFVGAGIGSMLFGNHNNGTNIVNNGSTVGGEPVVVNGGYASSSSGFGDFMLFILIILFIALIVYGIYKWVSRPRETVISVSQHSTHGDNYLDISTDNVKASTVTKSDKARFKNILIAIQMAWSDANLTVIRNETTNEMYDFFYDTLQHNKNSGIQNKVDNIRDIECDVLEAWEDSSGKYATAIMRWSAHDYTVNMEGEVVDKGTDGSVHETWTFIETSGGYWVLSAIQQMED